MMGGDDNNQDDNVGATALFHEGPSRVVLAVSAENSAAFVAAAQAASLPLLALGQSVAGDRLDWAGLFSVSLAEATARFDAGLDPIRRGRGEWVGRMLVLVPEASRTVFSNFVP